MQVPRGNVEIGKMGGADQSPPFGSTLSQQRSYGLVGRAGAKQSRGPGFEAALVALKC